MDPTNQEKFKKNFVGDFAFFIHEIVKDATEKGYRGIDLTVLDLGRGFISKFDGEGLIKGFIKHTHKYWDKIHAKDEDFLKSNADEIFKDIPVDMKMFKDLFEGKYLTTEDMNTLWDYFYSFVKISLKFLILNPDLAKELNLDLDKHCSLWNIKK